MTSPERPAERDSPVPSWWAADSKPPAATVSSSAAEAGDDYSVSEAALAATLNVSRYKVRELARAAGCFVRIERVVGRRIVRAPFSSEEARAIIHLSHATRGKRLVGRI